MTSSQALCTPSPGLGSGFANFCGFCFGLLCCLFRKENRRAPNQHPSRHFREPIPQPRFCFSFLSLRRYLSMASWG